MNFHARAVISDSEMMWAAINKHDVDKRIYNELAHSLSKKLVEESMDRITVKREFNPKNDSFSPYNFGDTIYELDCYVLSPDEFKEYEKFKKFQIEMRMFIK